MPTADGPAPMTAAEVHDAARVYVASASVDYQQQTAALALVLRYAHDRGLTVADLRTASGLDEQTITRLLQEDELR